MNHQPPSWADRFLAWYCSPDLLEEIQGDAHELYFERVEREGKRKADLKYMWDVFRFFRWSNIRRKEPQYVPGSLSIFWNLNLKMTARNAGKNKFIFFVKIFSLSICLAFALLLTAFVVNELSFDRFHTNHDRIYRVSSKVDFKDHTTHYAVTPLPIGQALVDEIPELENYFRFTYEDKPIYRLNENVFYDAATLAVDQNFLKILSYTFIEGNGNSLEGPDRIVLTESTARKFFGDADPLGQTVEFGSGFLLEVTGVIKDAPANSHLKFDALISWETFDPDDGWGNLNAYTFVLLKPGTDLQIVKDKILVAVQGFNELITREYDATYEPILENIADIHFSPPLDEDTAEKRDKDSLFVLVIIVSLFLLTGLVNYLNLSLAELTANLKKLGILMVFGGMSGSHRNLQLTEAIFTTMVVLPLVIAFGYAGWVLGATWLSIHIEPRVLTSFEFLAVTCGFFLLLTLLTQLNSFVISKASQAISSHNRIARSTEGSARLRAILVAAQLSFSIVMIAMILLIVNQFHFIEEADKGFDDKNTIVIKLRAAQPSETGSFKEALRKLHGVSHVDRCSYYPGAIETKYVFRVETEKGSQQILVPMMTCGPDYFDALNIKFAKGHGFEKAGEYGSFVINESAAREFGWRDPLGKQIGGPVSGQDDAYREGVVIGVMKDFNFASLHNKIEPLIIFPLDDEWMARFVYIKLNRIRPSNTVALIEKEFRAHWPDYPFEWEYLDTKYLSLYQKDYELKSIFEIGLVISVLISSLGIFSISALLVTVRTREMGIRKVVGASSFQLFFLHTKTFLQFLVIALVVACPVIWFLSDKWLQNFAYHIKLNAWNFIFPGIVALFITMITSCYHGFKSAWVNPVDILKHE